MALNSNAGAQGVALLDLDGALGAAATPLNVLPPFSRPGTAFVDFTPNGAYAIGDCMGLWSPNLGLAAKNVKVIGVSLHVPMVNNVTPGGNLGLCLFPGAPGGAWVDSDPPPWAAAGPVRRTLGFPFIFGPANSTIAQYGLTPAQPIDATTDAEGKLYFSAFFGNVVAWTTPSAASRFSVDFLY